MTVTTGPKTSSCAISESFVARDDGRRIERARPVGDGAAREHLRAVARRRARRSRARGRGAPAR